MMGHRYKARNGYEIDCIGHPEHRWRKYMPHNHGVWGKVKKCIRRRIRRENKAIFRKENERILY